MSLETAGWQKVAENSGGRWSKTRAASVLSMPSVASADVLELAGLSSGICCASAFGNWPASAGSTVAGALLSCVAPAGSATGPSTELWFACAAAQAVLREVIDNDLPQRATLHGQTIRATVEGWQHLAITEVRGKGLLLGVGLQAAAFDAPEGTPASIHLSKELAESGLLAPPAGPDTVRLMPPLTVSEEEIHEALGIFRHTLDRLCN